MLRSPAMVRISASMGRDAVLRIPILLASADAENEIGQNPHAVGGVDHFGMELDRKEADVRDAAMAAIAQVSVPASTSKSGGTRFHLVAMVHPDLRVAVQAFEKRVRLRRMQDCQAVLALVALSDVAAEFVRHELLAVADSQHGAAGSKNCGIDAGAVRLRRRYPVRRK